MTEPAKLISIAALQARLGQPGLRLLDCRFDLMNPAAGRQAWLGGHIPGAQYADLDQELAGPVRSDTGRHPLPGVEDFARQLGRWGIGNDSSVVVYDGGSGAIAARAWWMLRWAGHDDVALLDQGFAGWTAQHAPVETGETAVARAAFNARPRMEWVLGTDELQGRLQRGALGNLIDARDAARFRGEVEPIDPVAGHIPGSRNFPLAQSLQSDGRWKSAEELQALWLPVLGEPPGAPWAVMCGSGVTACHLAFSGQLAGFQAPRLYAGSWSEWIRDPSRPVASGAANPVAVPATAEPSST